MKKLLLLFAFFLTLNIGAHAQFSRTTNSCVSLELVGKYHMVITYLETKDSYRKGMSSREFVEANMSFLDPKVRPAYLTNYLTKVYTYHTQGLSPDQVYSLEDGTAFADMANGMAELVQQGMSKEEIELAVATGNDPSVQLKKPKWFNWLRKVIDWIDDNWK